MKGGDLSIRPMLCLLMLCFYFHVFGVFVPMLLS